MSHSQFDEEQHILAAFAHKTEPGRFLDLGAWDPITFSNTRALFELGWSGVMIEPSPGPMVEIMRTCTKCAIGVDDREHEPYGKRKQRECSKCGADRYGLLDRVTLVSAAAGLEPGFVKIHATDDALSTSDEQSRKTWEKDGGFYGTFLAPVITLEDIGNRFGGFDFISFDVEGTSTDLFLRMLALGWGPRCVCIETDKRDQEILSAATPLHYHCTYGNGTNLILVRQ